ncbi:MAG TPA: ATP-binding protein [Acidimicrobiia bacterium]|nr:ATP-binding protein [Acidimicrobiia bacterium]
MQLSESGPTRVRSAASIQASPWLMLLAFGLVYLALAELGLALRSSEVSVYWPAAGFLAAAVAITPRPRYLPLLAAVAAGTIFSNMIHGSSLATSLGFVVANGIEGLIAGWILSRRLPQRRRLVRIGDLYWLLVAAVAGPALGATLGGLTVIMTTTGTFGPTFGSWFVATATGIALVVPAVLAAVSLLKEPAPASWGRGTLLMVTVTGFCLAGTVVLSQNTGRNLTYLIMVPLVVTGMWLGPRATALITSGVALFVVWTSGAGLGPFLPVLSGLHPLIAAQTFLVVVQVLVLTLAIESGRRRDTIAELEGILHAAVEAVLVVDETWTIRRVNDGAIRLFEREASSLVSTNLASWLDIDEIESSSADGNLVLTKGRQGDGLPFWAEVSQGAIEEPSGRQRRAIIIRDVSGRIEADARVERLQDEFVSAMTHQLRNPLTAIIGYTDILLEDMPSDDAQSELNIIRRSAESLRVLIDDILTFKRAIVSNGLSRTSINLGELVEEALVVFKAAAEARGIDIESNLEPIPTFVGEKRQLDDAIQNLLSNAIKYSQEGGKIRVSLRRREDEVSLVVSDDGIGISQDDQRRLFERFYRARNAIDEGIPGTGLGLALVRQVARNHGGQVNLQSQLGRGTTVEVRLPLVERADPFYQYSS